MTDKNESFSESPIRGGECPMNNFYLTLTTIIVILPVFLILWRIILRTNSLDIARNTLAVILTLVGVAVWLLLCAAGTGALTSGYLYLGLLTGNVWYALGYKVLLGVLLNGLLVIWTVWRDEIPTPVRKYLARESALSTVGISLSILVGLLIAQALFLEKLFPNVDPQTMYYILVITWLLELTLGKCLKSQLRNSLKRYLR